MSVRYGAPDTFSPLVSLYLCRCGRAAEQHGRHAGELPRGWVDAGGAPEPDPVCPSCVAAGYAGRQMET